MGDYKTRQAEPNMAFGYTTPEGDQKTLKADKDGKVTPRDAFEDGILNTFALPVTAAQRERKTAKPRAARTRKPSSVPPAQPASVEPAAPPEE